MNTVTCYQAKDVLSTSSDKYQNIINNQVLRVKSSLKWNTVMKTFSDI